MARLILKAFAALLAVSVLQAQALQLTSVSPQGEIARVRQIAVKFDDSAVNFGDPKVPAPVSLSSSGAQAQRLPWPGRHLLQPVDARGKVLDEIRLKVRGAGVREAEAGSGASK